MQNIKTEIAKNLLYYRKKNKLTQKQLADKLGVKNSAISNWETGLNSIDIDTLHKACTILDVDMNTMFSTTTGTSKQQPPLTTKEKHLLDQFNQLNNEGQERATEYTEDLVNGGRYKKFDVTQLVEKA